MGVPKNDNVTQSGKWGEAAEPWEFTPGREEGPPEQEEAPVGGGTAPWAGGEQALGGYGRRNGKSRGDPARETLGHPGKGLCLSRRRDPVDAAEAGAVGPEEARC